jgi:hypothetical protein
VSILSIKDPSVSREKVSRETPQLAELKEPMCRPAMHAALS